MIDLVQTNPNIISHCYVISVILLSATFCLQLSKLWDYLSL